MTIRLIAVMILCAVALPTAAQKSSKTDKTEKTKPVQVQQTAFRDLLLRIEGKTTNVGVVKKVGTDHFILEEEGRSTTYTLGALLGIRTIRDEETNEEHIELLFAAHD